MKKPTLANLKKKLDATFSRWVRQRGADEGGTNTCVTCGRLAHISELHAGHYYSRRYTAVRWHELNVWPQCPRCNIFMSGNYPAYARFLLNTIGQSAMEELDYLHRQTTKLTRSDLEAMIQKYEGDIG